MSAAVVASARDRASATSTATMETSPKNLELNSHSAEARRQQHGQADESFTEANSARSKVSTPTKGALVDQMGSETPVDGTSSPLPADLRRILLEVVQSGSSSQLPWRNASEGLSTAGGRVALPSCTSRSAGATVQQQHHHTTMQHQRRPIPIAYSAATGTTSSGQPPRKKHRNGVHPRSNRRFPEGRKRPLLLIRTTSSASSTVFSPPGSSVGSEPEDTSQYECDSEGTSATSNSELSFDRRDFRKRAWPTSAKVPATASTEERMASHGGTRGTGSNHHFAPYASLMEAFRVAVSLVLEHYYKHRGGYKLSPAEKRKYAIVVEGEKGTTASGATEKQSPGSMKGVANGVPNAESGKMTLSSSIAEEEIFHQRRQRLLSALEPPAALPSSAWLVDDGPPFTVQRIAEVLVSPERYYTQTHKLCNCLEKLLLVTSSASAFGGSTGGVTMQSKREEREIAALNDEKGRQQAQLRQRRLRRRASSSMSDEISAEANDITFAGADKHVRLDENRGANSPTRKKSAESVNGSESASRDTSNADETSREMLEAAARASLRTKFDHVGIDPHHAAANSRDVNAIAENRGMTNSPPPPSISVAAAGGTGISLSGHGGILRQHHDQAHHGVARPPSPIFGESSSSPPIRPVHANPNIQLLQMSHAAAVAGYSPFELMALHSAHNNDAASPSSAVAATIAGLHRDIDLESRSSASSDVDSESDSFDDSASDRSDGSDSGGHYEPFIAARAMALNRIQQQRLQQTRIMTSMYHQASADRTLADSEYQCGDSMDSMKADDSGGSDSSSSEMVD